MTDDSMDSLSLRLSFSMQPPHTVGSQLTVQCVPYHPFYVKFKGKPGGYFSLPSQIASDITNYVNMVIYDKLKKGCLIAC